MRWEDRSSFVSTSFIPPQQVRGQGRGRGVGVRTVVLLSADRQTDKRTDRKRFGLQRPHSPRAISARRHVVKRRS